MHGINAYCKCWFRDFSSYHSFSMHLATLHMCHNDYLHGLLNNTHVSSCVVNALCRVMVPPIDHLLLIIYQIIKSRIKSWNLCLPCQPTHPLL